MKSKEEFLETLDNLREVQKKFEEEADERCIKEWNNLDYDLKLDILRYIGWILVEHAQEGGSYRYLLYSKLGLDMDAYCYLLDSYMTISNEFILSKSIPRDELLDQFSKLVSKIPAYLTEEDKEKWNFNEDRGLAFDLLRKIDDINEALAKSEEKYNRLMDEYKNLLELYKDDKDE